MTDENIVLTGIKPTGEPHLGHAVGAIQPGLEMAAEEGVRPFFFMADYHALTSMHDPDRLEEATYEVAATWLALGLDPEEMLFYRQSDIPEIFELTWILSCFTGKGLMNRAHAYKAAVDANREQGEDEDAGIDMGLYTYPVLMAADILMFDADEVPVGADQIQHVEIARDIAGSINHTYDEELFKLPEHRVQDVGGAIPGLDGRKMSNSYDNYIPLWVDSDDLKDTCFQIETDSSPREAPKDPDDSVVFDIYESFATDEQADDLASRLREGIGWGDAKLELFELLDDVLAEPRERYNELMADRAQIDAILEEGAERAREIARPKLETVRESIGIDRS
ncbi:MAG: tryptophan--tRNA ligase [Bradymonadaceae bacterium]